MQIGLFHSIQWPEGSAQSDRYEQSLAQACYADELGFDSVWLTEHHFSRHGIASDSLAVLSHLAARTEQIRLGTAVSVLPLHNPMRLAETAATVDQLSKGRLDLGIGRGYQVGEFTGFGVDMGEKAERFAEAVDVLQRVWGADEPLTYNGTYFQCEGAWPQPRPYQDPHPPIWVATDSPDGLARCAESDWGVLLPQGTTLEVTADQMQRYHGALDGAGVSHDRAKVYLARAGYLAPTDDEARATAGGPYLEFLSYADKLRRGSAGASSESGRSPFDIDADLSASTLFGSPDSVIADLRKIRDLGIDRVMLFMHLGGLPHEKIMASLELCAREVIPAVREF